MASGSVKQLTMRALVAHANQGRQTMSGRAIQAVLENLSERGVEVTEAYSPAEAAMAITVDAGLQCAILDWDMEQKDSHTEIAAALATIRQQNSAMPVFLMALSSQDSKLPPKVLEQVDDFLWLLENTPDFIGGRIMAAIHRYQQQFLPPMFGALARFSGLYEYSWHTPGHTGGTAFLKHPAGQAFFEFFGEQLLRSDLSVSVEDLGSLLDHTGPIGDSEKYAAHVFGAHRSYHVTNGSSTSNRVILMASVTRDDVVLVDRNCHKSVVHALTLAGARPLWLVPSRNYLGMIGPVRAWRMAPDEIEKGLATSPLTSHADASPAPMHAILTNSTYDGLCYNVLQVEELLGKVVDRLHFDEAWFSYARFNSLYAGHFAMHGNPAAHGATRPTVFATQSTHKMLAALSQASFIHIRDGKRPIEHHRFNEALMMHASTSPQYAIIASNDVSTAMMDGPSGETLTTESIAEAVAFRQTIARIHNEFHEKGDWFFSAWQPDEVIESNGRKVPFHLADEQQLIHTQHHWVLKPDEEWHGFKAIDDNYCLLDPIKVSVITPGLSRDGSMEATGIPAALLTAYLDRQGIIVEKTTNFTILFLFSLGITKGKWGTLVNALLDFKRDYDANMPLARTLPDLVAAHPMRYATLGLRDLAHEMFETMRDVNATSLLTQAFSNIPAPVYTPTETYEQLVRDNIEPVRLEDIAGRIVATAIVPYPPGIPLLMPGENIGANDGPVLGYLRSMEFLDRTFPGFTHGTHGVEVVNGEYRIHCLKQGAALPNAK